MSEFIVKSEAERKRLIEMINLLDIKRGWRFSWGQYRKRRSLSMNALQHVWYREIGRQLGVDQGKVKLFLKTRFLGSRIAQYTDLDTGEELQIEVPASTSSLDMGEALHYMEQVEFWAMEHGIMLDAPEDSDYTRAQRAMNE